MTYQKDLAVLVKVAEKIISKIEIQTEIYPKIRDAVVFCRNWIDDMPVEEELIYELLDDEDENDLVGYYVNAENEKDKSIEIRLGVPAAHQRRSGCRLHGHLQSTVAEGGPVSYRTQGESRCHV